MIDNIQMVDLRNQYLKIKQDIDNAIHEVIDSTEFIKGKKVKEFESHLANYLGVKHVISCGNGTDALQIALMSLDLKAGDEIITTPFTFIATVEVIALLGLTPKFVDIDRNTFNINELEIEKAITSKTKAILPVHLYGQPSNMGKIMQIAQKHKLFVVEDSAQAIGANYKFDNGTQTKAGTIGDIGCTSFFPSKNLGCFGDGGALFTNDDLLAEKIRMITNHGMKVRYYHETIGVNSRLDTIQAAVLDVKLNHLDSYIQARKKSADYYSQKLSGVKQVRVPVVKYDHVFHQYTLIVEDETRDELRKYLESKNIPSMIYYPVPIHLQKAFQSLGYNVNDFPVTEYLSKHVLSLPMHTELTIEHQDYICNAIIEFYQ